MPRLLRPLTEGNRFEFKINSVYSSLSKLQGTGTEAVFDALEQELEYMTSKNKALGALQFTVYYATNSTAWYVNSGIFIPKLLGICDIAAKTSPVKEVDKSLYDLLMTYMLKSNHSQACSMELEKFEAVTEEHLPFYLNKYLYTRFSSKHYQNCLKDISTDSKVFNSLTLAAHLQNNRNPESTDQWYTDYRTGYLWDVDYLLNKYYYSLQHFVLDLTSPKVALSNIGQQDVITPMVNYGALQTRLPRISYKELLLQVYEGRVSFAGNQIQLSTEWFVGAGNTKQSVEISYYLQDLEQLTFTLAPAPMHSLHYRIEDLPGVLLSKNKERAKHNLTNLKLISKEENLVLKDPELTSLKQL